MMAHYVHFRVALENPQECQAQISHLETLGTNPVALRANVGGD